MYQDNSQNGVINYHNYHGVFLSSEGIKFDAS